MNKEKNLGPIFRMAYRLMLRTRWVCAKPVCESFCGTVDRRLNVIQQIRVINLDRQVDRWNNIQQELNQIYSSSGTNLNEIAKRFSAVDARYYTGVPNKGELQTFYSIADQLFVEPHPFLARDRISNSQNIEMTHQEIAVALSHIALWKQIASSNYPYTLVLEDDVYFRRGFARTLEKAWDEVITSHGPSEAFDVLYLSYKEAENKAEKQGASDFLFKPLRGLWQLSGYVLSKKGAEKLLGLLPVRGPVDLWINHQFDKLDVFATYKSIISQRLDFQSTNSYSILPALSRLGVLTQEKPLLLKTPRLPKPVFGFGKHGTGLTSLAMALSMLGYRCCSDINELPKGEHDHLFGKKKSRVFDAYVNVGSLSGSRYIELAKLYPGARFIITVSDKDEQMERNRDLSNRQASRWSNPSYKGGSLRTMYMLLRKYSVGVLVLPMQSRHKWDLLCEFLECEYPASKYPAIKDQGQRHLSIKSARKNRRAFPGLRKLKFDSSPWISVPRKQWTGIRFVGTNSDDLDENSLTTISERFQTLDNSLWNLLDDTFPSNLAIFNPNNFSITNKNLARLTLRKEKMRVREYTSASICSRRDFLYGRFSTLIKPASVPGLVTGVFLHRNSPRQEIDIEFLGKDTNKLLVNVFYNPGDEGANFEYGYRGTPILVDLGFDASKDFHQYSIEWSPTSIRWFVDGRLAYERTNWDPTPIPHLPMQFYINLWHSRSEELAGRLLDRELPSHSEIKSIDIHAQYIASSSSRQAIRSRKTAIMPEFKNHRTH